MTSSDHGRPRLNHRHHRHGQVVLGALQESVQSLIHERPCCYIDPKG
jgi:hypothetical protein